jgi:hypothetical protein
MRSPLPCRHAAVERRAVGRLEVVAHDRRRPPPQVDRRDLRGQRRGDLDRRRPRDQLAERAPPRDTTPIFAPSGSTGGSRCRTSPSTSSIIRLTVRSSIRTARRTGCPGRA